MALGKQVKRYREQLGLTLEDLEELSGVAVGTISALEVRDSARSKYAPALAKALGITLDQLLDESHDAKAQPSRRVIVNDQLVSITDRTAIELFESYEASSRSQQLVADLALGRRAPKVSDALLQAVNLAVSLAGAEFPGGQEHKTKKRKAASVS